MGSSGAVSPSGYRCTRSQLTPPALVVAATRAPLCLSAQVGRRGRGAKSGRNDQRAAPYAAAPARLGFVFPGIFIWYFLTVTLSVVLARQNAAADAEWCLQAAVAIEPSLPLASLLLSELHLAGGNVAVAESDAFYERDNVPDADGALFQLAKVAVASKQTEAALGYVLRAVHMNPARGDYWAELQKLKQKPAAQPSAKK